jgi:exosortase A-associated hydrolase 2
MTAAPFEPMFLEVEPGPLGQRFAIHHPPQGGAVRGLVVYVHPFAEEMNKSRRMAALQSRALAANGFAVLQMDLLGCGDSAGDFGDATWERWVADVVFACRWLRERAGHGGGAGDELPPLWLWGLRAGCLLAVEAARELDNPCHFLFWQPATSGKPLLQQTLRLKIAGEILGGQARGLAEQLRAELQSGRCVDIAGYTLGPALCEGLERAMLHPPERAGRVEWLEVSPRDGASPAPVAASAAARWVDARWAMHTQVVQGPAFWQTAEIEDAPALIEASVAALSRAEASAADQSRPLETVHP